MLETGADGLIVRVILSHTFDRYENPHFLLKNHLRPVSSTRLASAYYYSMKETLKGVKERARSFSNLSENSHFQIEWLRIPLTISPQALSSILSHTFDLGENSHFFLKNDHRRARQKKLKKRKKHSSNSNIFKCILLSERVAENRSQMASS